MRVKEESEKAGLKFNSHKSDHGKFKGKKWKQWQTLFSWAPKPLRTVTPGMKLKDTYSL